MENLFETEWIANLRHRSILLFALILLGLGILPFKIPLNSFGSSMLFLIGAWFGNYGVISPEKNEFTMKHENKKVNYFLNIGFSPDIDHNLLLNRSIMHSGILLMGFFIFGTLNNAFLLGIAFGWVIHIIADIFHPGEWIFEPISRIVALSTVILFLFASGWIII